MKKLGLCLLGLLALGCAETGTTTMDKSDARARVAKGDAPFDFCAEFGWYGDGICDDFCANPDPDCGGDQYCYSDGDCGDGERCNAGEVCLSDCPEGMACPAVCAGFCVEDTGNDECWGAWVDQYGNCRTPADGVYPDECCYDNDDFCGGFAGFTCDDDQWCDYTDTNVADGGGYCKPRPEVCYEIYAPVCGTDGQTYGNDCKAHAAGADVQFEGACPTDVQELCGGFLGLTCGDDQWCDMTDPPEGAASDFSGLCKARPEICYEVYAPVCGRDGETYSNDCFAHAAGVDDKHPGACE